MDAATRAFARQRDERQEAYTAAVVAGYRAASVGLAQLGAALARAVAALDVPLTLAELYRLPEWRRLMEALAAALVVASEAVEERTPRVLADAEGSAVDWLDELDAATAPVHQDRNRLEDAVALAAAYLLARRRGAREHAERLLSRDVVYAATRSRAGLTAAVAKELVSKRVAAEVAHSLTVLNSETARVERQVVEIAIGGDGDWVWVTSGDGSVCDECADREGRLYPASELFAHAHPNCRCIPVPAR